jgi:hypothetical protein
VLITQAGSTLTAPAGFASYQWYRDGAPIAGATSNTLITTQGGNYYVIVSNSNCQGQSNSIIVLSIASAENTSSTISLFPNPNKGEFSIVGHVGSGSGEITICVTDVLGRIIGRINSRVINGKVDCKYKMPENSPSGLYTVKVTSQEVTSSVPFVKE